MILSDTQIRIALRDGRIVIKGDIDEDIQIQPASMDLRLGKQVRRFLPSAQIGLDPPTAEEEIDEKNPLIIMPGEFVLACTHESVALPCQVKSGYPLVGRLEGRSSWGRLGIIVHATAGYVDPGWIGPLTLEMANFIKSPVAIPYLSRICQMTFEEVYPVARPYGQARGSKYNNQPGAQPSRISEDIK